MYHQFLEKWNCSNVSYAHSSKAVGCVYIQARDINYAGFFLMLPCSLFGQLSMNLLMFCCFLISWAESYFFRMSVFHWDFLVRLQYIFFCFLSNWSCYIADFTLVILSLLDHQLDFIYGCLSTTCSKWQNKLVLSL